MADLIFGRRLWKSRSVWSAPGLPGAFGGARADRGQGVPPSPNQKAALKRTPSKRWRVVCRQEHSVESGSFRIGCSLVCLALMKSRVLLGSVFLLAVAALALLMQGPNEPVCRGHPISYWIEPWQHLGTEPEENIAAAFSEMDERAVRWLTAQLDWRPSRLKAAVNDLVAKVISARFFNDRPDRREIAAMGLGRLGPRAASAVPALEAVLRNTPAPRADSACAAALAALIRIEHEPLAAYLEKLRDPTAPDWQMVAWAMWHLGTNAAPAVPSLVKALEKPADEGTVRTTVSALAAIHSCPELTVPALAGQLEHADYHVRGCVIQGLSVFGAAAKPAWPALTPRLQDPELIVRVLATNALKQIDPEAAQQLGVE